MRSSFLLPLFSTTFHCFFHPAWAAYSSPRTFILNSQQNFDTRTIQGWSGGGGDRLNITSDSNHPFSGRQFGGALRSELKGTRTFGSGYPYGAVDNTTVAGRPFPFGLWPIYWGNNTMGSDEYGQAVEGLRPGGQLVTVALKTEVKYYNITEGEMYYILGDQDSAIFMMVALVTTCHVTPAWPSRFLPDSATSTVKIENVVQYYRASSFALTFPGYSNTFTRSSSNTESTDSTPLPDAIVYSNFRRCIDDVIVNALPIMDQPVDTSAHLGDTLGLAFGVGTVPFLIIVCIFGSCVQRKRQEWRIQKELKARNQEWNLANRQTTLGYQYYP